MSRLACISLAVTIAALLGPSAPLAHNGKDPLLVVPLDHVMPGRPFPIVGSDVGPDSRLSFEIRQGDHVAQLGTAVAQGDGHFQTTVSLPEDFPDGYAYLAAKSSSGRGVATWVLVGERAESKPAPRGDAWWHAPWVAGFALVAAAGAVLAAVAARRRADRRSA